MRTNTSKAIIIGAGFGGLAAAALLAKDGYDVEVFEKNNQPGGRAQVWKKDGFLFDMGPSWYLMPDVFEKFFGEFGRKPSDFFKLKRLDPSYRIWFGENDYIDMPTDLSEIKKIFAKLEVDGDKKLEKYLAQAKYQYDVAMDRFIYRSYNSWKDILDKQLMVEGAKLNVFGSMGKLAEKYFDSEKARKILLYTIVFLGGSPKVTPALYSIMTHIDFSLGVWYPMEGINKVALAIESLGKKHGAKFHYSKAVDEIIVEEGKAVGVRIGKKINKADLVVVNADYHFAETCLLESKYQSYPEKYWKKKTVAPSALIFYLGISKKIKNLQHHTLFFDGDWEAHFENIFSNPSWPRSDPSFYVCAPSKTDNTVAPKNMENLFVLIPVASGLDDNEGTREKYFEQVIDRMEKLTRESIKEHIIVKRSFAHKDFAKEYNAYKGTALGLAHTLSQTAFLRPKQKSDKVQNLFYTGQYTHPGIGMPITLISSSILHHTLTHEK